MCTVLCEAQDIATASVYGIADYVTKPGAAVMEHAKYKVLLIEDNKLDRMAFERFVEDQKLL